MIKPPIKSIYEYELTTIDGEKVKFEKYKKKKILIVNTASKCGFTPQYKKLQELHTKYGDKITILGFPSNDFGGQEPGSNSEIGAFCKKNYGVTFQLFEKINVVGENQHPIFKWLSNKELNGWNQKAPTWNFCKYLINEKGELVQFLSSFTSPTSKEIINFIEN